VLRKIHEHQFIASTISATFYRNDFYRTGMPAFLVAGLYFGRRKPAKKRDTLTLLLFAAIPSTHIATIKESSLDDCSSATGTLKKVRVCRL